MEWYMGHVSTHVPHLDLVDFGQNVFATASPHDLLWSHEKNFKSVDAMAL